MSSTKISEALGIENVEDYLKDLDVDEGHLKEIDDKVKENLANVDSQIEQYKNCGIDGISVPDISESLNEVKELIIDSKTVLKHTLESVVTSEISDPELLGSFSKLVESLHLTIAEYIGLYKDRMAFVDRVRFEYIKHQNKLEEMDHKHKLDIEKMNMKAIDVTPTASKNPDFVEWKQEDNIG